MMPFDLSTAKPVDNTGGFDLSTAKPVPEEGSAPVVKKDVDSKVASFEKGLIDPVSGAAQLLTHVLPEKAVEAGNELNNWLSKYGVVAPIPSKTASGAPVQGAAAMDELLKQQEAELASKRTTEGRTGTDWPRLAGNVLSPMNLAIAAKTPEAATLAARLAIGAGQGAAASSLAPVTEGDFAKEKAKQIALGTVTGGVIPAVASGAARVVKPLTSEAVKTLADKGVTLTPGQILGGWMGRVEEGLTSLPIIGDSIKGAQRRGIVTFNNAAINDALKPIRQSLPKGVEGNQAIAYAREALGNAYDDLLPKMKGDLHATVENALPGKVGQTTKLSLNDELENIRKIGENLPEQQRKDLNRIIDQEVKAKFTEHGKASGDTIKNIQQVLNAESSKFAISNDPYHRQLAGGIKEIGSAVRRMVKDVNPQYAEELNKIDSGYASFKLAQKAAGSVAAKDGFFTPAMYHNAVKAADKTKDKRAFAEGLARGQKLSAAGKKVLSQTVPDSGTPLRGLLEAAAVGGVGSAAGVPYAAGALAAPALYSEPGTKTAQALLMSRPEIAAPLAELIRRSSPALTAGAVPLSQLMTRPNNQ